MNVARFLKKCLTDPPAAASSARLATRDVYGRIYWWLWPNAPLLYRFATGGKLQLYPRHSFTECFWPGVDFYEPDVQGALPYLLRRGDTFIDCGANVGYFSILASDLVGPAGQVISIEANPLTYELLKGNLVLNERGTPIHCALTNAPGDVDIYVSDLGDVYSSLRTGGLVKGDSVRSHKVPGRTLDQVVQELDLDRVDLVKVDIEGGELDVLQSAEMIMTKFRPTWIVEYSTNTWAQFGASAKELLRLATDRKYAVQMFDDDTGALVSAPPETWDSHYANVILVPSERLNTY